MDDVVFLLTFREVNFNTILPNCKNTASKNLISISFGIKFERINKIIYVGEIKISKGQYSGIYLLLYFIVIFFTKYFLRARKALI